MSSFTVNNIGRPVKRPILFTVKDDISPYQGDCELRNKFLVVTIAFLLGELTSFPSQQFWKTFIIRWNCTDIRFLGYGNW